MIIINDNASLKNMSVIVNVSWCLHRLQEAGNFGHKEFWVTWLGRLLRIITEHFDSLICCFISIFSILSGSVLPLGKMELNPVTGLVLLSKATSVSDDKPSLADLDTDSDEEDGQGIDQTWGQIQEFDRGRGRGEASFDLKKKDYFSLCWTLTYISKGMIQAK